MSERIAITLICSDCQSRNYRTTRKRDFKGSLEKKKFCPKCKSHTLHKETK